MAATARRRGHLIYFDEKVRRWRYVADKSFADYDRRCPRCNQMPTPEGYDACMGKEGGAEAVCCGYGVTEPIIQMLLVDLAKRVHEALPGVPIHIGSIGEEVI